MAIWGEGGRDEEVEGRVRGEEEEREIEDEDGGGKEGIGRRDEMRRGSRVGDPLMSNSGRR
jgi:hypothetical protein